jgi:hypothetical protein
VGVHEASKVDVAIRNAWGESQGLPAGTARQMVVVLAADRRGDDPGRGRTDLMAEKNDLGRLERFVYTDPAELGPPDLGAPIETLTDDEIAEKLALEEPATRARVIAALRAESQSTTRDGYEFTYYDSVVFRRPGRDGSLFDRYLRGHWMPARGELFPSEEEWNHMESIPEHLALAILDLPFPEKKAAVRRWRVLTHDGKVA